MTAKTKAADVLHGPPLDERELAEVYRFPCVTVPLEAWEEFVAARRRAVAALLFDPPVTSTEDRNS